MYNSLQQDPCHVAIKLAGVCFGGGKFIYIIVSNDPFI
jgi:hypothetical protein